MWRKFDYIFYPPDIIKIKKSDVNISRSANLFRMTFRMTFKGDMMADEIPLGNKKQLPAPVTTWISLAKFSAVTLMEKRRKIKI